MLQNHINHGYLKPCNVQVKGREYGNPGWLFYSVTLKLLLVSHIFFWTMNTTSSSPCSFSSESPVATASQCSADICFFTNSTTDGLSRIIMKPVGLKMRSISIKRSTALQSFFAMSEKTVQACSKS